MISIEKSNIGTTLLPKMTTTGWENINQLVTGSNNQDHTGMEFEFQSRKIFFRKFFTKNFYQKCHIFSKIQSDHQNYIFKKAFLSVYLFGTKYVC